MRRTLRAMHNDGGIAKPAGGGWWNGESGRRLSFKLAADDEALSVSSNTIYALHTRGLIEKVTPDLGRWCATYRITEAGNRLLQEWADADGKN